MIILGIETSCDETSAAILNRNKVISNIISSQAVHLKFGGVVPELASRAHLKKIIPIVDEALKVANLQISDIEGFAVTFGPGLVGALLVGLNYVKGLSISLNKPFVGVNHIEGHIYSNFIGSNDLFPPFMTLVVSGGHTQLVLVTEHLKYKIVGTTRDDAVGEAFDKVGKLLGLSYPAGPQVDKLSENGNPEFVNFPRALLKESIFDFSFSGLKTAVLNYSNKIPKRELKIHLNDICASFQAAAIEVLIKKTVKAARYYQIRKIAICGGVAANRLLRSLMTKEAEKYNLELFIPPLDYCTDNAAMIARAGLERLKRGMDSNLNLNAYPSLRLGTE